MRLWQVAEEEDEKKKLGSECQAKHSVVAEILKVRDVISFKERLAPERRLQRVSCQHSTQE